MLTLQNVMTCNMCKEQFQALVDKWLQYAIDYANTDALPSIEEHIKSLKFEGMKYGYQ